MGVPLESLAKLWSLSHSSGVPQFTDHALFEMKRRGISEHDVRQVCEHPGQRIPLPNQREIWQNKVVIDGNEYVLRVVVETSPTLKVVTVYRSSKTKKYWRAP